MENNWRQIIILYELTQPPVNHLPLNQSAVRIAKHKIIVCKYIAKQSFIFFNLSFALFEHFRNDSGDKPRLILVLVFGSFSPNLSPIAADGPI